MNFLRISRLSKWVYNDRHTDKKPPMFQMIEIKYIYQNKKDRGELLGSNEKYFYIKINKTHLTVVFSNLNVTHFFRQFVAQKEIS